ncbi:SCAN domain-containing protein 3-like 4, partial [Homarus americanus]
MIHRQALTVKVLQADLKEVMSDVKVVDYIKDGFDLCVRRLGLNISLCCTLLSRGNVLERVFQLRTEIEIFLEEKEHNLAGKFRDSVWIALLCYLVDIFSYLKAWNTLLQGPGELVISLSEKIQAFRSKLNLLGTKLETERVAEFPNDVQDIIGQHLRSLRLRMEQYFPDIDPVSYVWVWNPFRCSTEHLPEESNGIAEEILEMKSIYAPRDMYAKIVYPENFSMNTKLRWLTDTHHTSCYNAEPDTGRNKSYAAGVRGLMTLASDWPRTPSRPQTFPSTASFLILRNGSAPTLFKLARTNSDEVTHYQLLQLNVAGSHIHLCNVHGHGQTMKHDYLLKPTDKSILYLGDFNARHPYLHDPLGRSNLNGIHTVGGTLDHVLQPNRHRRFVLGSQRGHTPLRQPRYLVSDHYVEAFVSYYDKIQFNDDLTDTVN